MPELTDGQRFSAYRGETKEGTHPDGSAAAAGRESEASRTGAVSCSVPCPGGHY